MYLNQHLTLGSTPAKPNQNEDLRKSGIDVIGSVPWGTHFCQFYASSHDLVETLVPYFKAGLEGNEFCMWVTSAPLNTEQAQSALKAVAPELDDYIKKGQIEILDYSQWYLPGGHFNADRVLQGWKDKLAGARQRGYVGLRLTGNTFWLEQSDWEDFTRYEEKINTVIGSLNMIALCTYSLEKCGVREILDVVANHQFAIIKNAGKWEIIESSEHKKTEQALRESEERMSLAVTAAELGVFEWYVQSDQANWENSRMYEIFGRTEQDKPLSKAQFMEQVIYPEDAAGFEAALFDGMQPGHLFHAITRIKRCNDGELRWVEFSGRFNNDAHDDPYLLNGVIVDITERMRYEEKLRENAARLEQLNRELQDFAYIASHDMKEPLRKISSFGERLKEKASSKLGKEEQDYLDRMTSSAARMQTMIDNLLAYSRVTTQVQPLSIVDFSKLTMEVLSDLEIRIEQSQGKVEVEPLPVIEADGLQMRQLLQNLIANALKFHKPGVPPYVRISSRSLPDNRVEIIIEDNGIGFEMQDSEKLFQPFHRLVGRGEYEGTGIGLAICRKIVERHKGCITVDSVPGQGTTFRVTLPLRQI